MPGIFRYPLQRLSPSNCVCQINTEEGDVVFHKLCQTTQALNKIASILRIKELEKGLRMTFCPRDQKWMARRFGYGPGYVILSENCILVLI
jgi:hypothetical protein